ncbi:TonB-dependent receptor, partial [bacterium]|nr:TonB-dependent receptor [bacterium]
RNNLFNRTLISSGKDHAGSNVYHDRVAYREEGDKFVAEGSPRGDLYTWTEQKALADYNYDPVEGESKSRSHETSLSISGPLGNKGGFFLDGGFSQIDGAFPFDRTKRINGSLKLHYSLSPGRKLSGMFQLSDGGELFNFVNWKFNPRYKYYVEGAPRYKDLATVSYLNYTHTVNASTFFEVRASHTTNISRVGYPDDDGDGIPELGESGDFIEFKDIDEYIKYVGGNGEVGSENGFVFGSTDQRVFFSSTLNPAGWQKLNQAEFPVNGIGVNGQYLTAYPLAMYQEFERDKINLKADVTSQVTHNHQIKAGLSYTRHNINVNTFVPELYGRGEEYPTSKAHVQFLDFNPQELAAYVQDRIEYEGLIVNVGLRLDGFDNDTELFANEFDPVDQINNNAGDFLRYDPKRGDAVGFEWFLSPRVGVSHPVTDNLAMHYSFGRYFQYPNYASIYEDYNFTNYAASPSPPAVRPDQDPVRSTNYEIGAQWSFTDDFLINATGYYRDVENTGSQAYTLTTSENLPIQFNTTWGYSDARGIELELSKRPGKWWGGRISYAFTYIKQAGSVGDFTTAFSAGQDSTEFARLPWDELDRRPSRERNIIVTQGGSNQLSGGFDRPHRVNGTLQLFFPARFNATFIGEWTSGFYFQQFFDQPANPDPFFDRNLNLETGPSSFFVNARVSKRFNFANTGVEAFFEARNLFNRTNIRSIANEPAREQQDREIWELGRPDPADGSNRLTEANADPEGTLMMPTDSFGRPFYLNAREFYFGFNFSLN